MTIATRRVGFRRLSEIIDLHVARLPSELRSETRDELLRKNKCGLIDLGHSRIVVERKRIIAWLLVEKHADSSWHFHLPETDSGDQKSLESEQIRRRLLTDLRADFDDGRGWIAQSLLTQDQVHDADLLSECGFYALTGLQFMTRVSDRDPPAVPTGDWQVESWTQERDGQFAAAIERTYEGTRDCPELNGSRTGQQALTSHTLSGIFDPKLWRVYSHNGDDVGIALLSPHSDNSGTDSAESKSEQQVWEIVYVGVAALHRNRGLAKRMLADMLQLAREGGASEVMLGVDVRNEPAIRLYEQFGFRLFDRRRVHARLRRR
ncbi:MAG: GNAT family N-acetyltransferase [Planctomycetes bacterium]|nr:GNAT family N-acetyltransferase [Planctomycetota bacterium]